MKSPAFIKENLLLKITSLNSVAIGVRALLGVVSQRIVAEKLGPAGVAFIGDLRNIIPMIQSFSTLGMFNGIVKYVAEYKEDKEELLKLFSTTFVYLFFTSIISFCVLFFGASYWNEWLFPEGSDFTFVFKVLAIAVPFIAMNRIVNGIINGLSAYKKFVKIELVNYCFGVVFLISLLYYKNLNGALFAIAILPIMQFFILFYFFSKTLKEYLDYKNFTLTIPYKNKLFGFTLMSFVATLLGNFIDIDLRGHLKNQISETDAGYWTSMTNLSRQYLMFSSAILTLYVIPKFSKIKTSIEFRKEVFTIYKTLLPLFAIGMILIFILKEWVIEITHGEDFLAMSFLFKWQLLGDFIKIATLIMAHQFLAKKMVIQFIVTELISLVLFYGFSIYFIKSIGAEGIVLAHFLRYIICFILIVFLLRKHLFGNNKI
ncbi:MAG: O-antigen flippase [Kordia sp.]|nr:MAG: O-antigen flippase [Kordia sp.]